MDRHDDQTWKQTHLFEPGEVLVEINGSLHAPSPSLVFLSLLLSDMKSLTVRALSCTVSLRERDVNSCGGGILWSLCLQRGDNSPSSSVSPSSPSLLSLVSFPPYKHFFTFFSSRLIYPSFQWTLTASIYFSFFTSELLPLSFYFSPSDSQMTKSREEGVAGGFSSLFCLFLSKFWTIWKQ